MIRRVEIKSTMGFRQEILTAKLEIFKGNSLKPWNISPIDVGISQISYVLCAFASDGHFVISKRHLPNSIISNKVVGSSVKFSQPTARSRVNDMDRAPATHTLHSQSGANFQNTGQSLHLILCKLDLNTFKLFPFLSTQMFRGLWWGRMELTNGPLAAASWAGDYADDTALVQMAFLDWRW